jgi:UDP-N-acetylmuramate dehydrogenase
LSIFANLNNMKIAPVSPMKNDELHTLQMTFGTRVRRDVPLSRYTSARVGGPAKALIIVRNGSELVDTVRQLWSLSLPFVILGGGSNVLVSDAGFQGVVVLNRARKVRFDVNHEPATVWTESGANLGLVARQAAAHGLTGLEWAAGIPGTVGGAIVGNAGAHGEDMASNLLMAEILHRRESVSGLKNGKKRSFELIRENWLLEQFEYSYRNSLIKRIQRQPSLQQTEEQSITNPQPQIVVLAARLRLSRSMPESIQEKMEEILVFRRNTQPPGASMGSMFKNPPSDYAGRLIEAAGLKGIRKGDAEISQLHANFFINHGNATASEILELIQLARRTVNEKFGIILDLEIELLGTWNQEDRR